jgi:hypothetical protein
MRGSRLPAVFVVLTALALTWPGVSGCGSDSGEPEAVAPPEVTGPTGPTGKRESPQVCTLIGCDSGLFANLKGLRRSNPSVSKVELCLGSSCDTFTRGEFAYTNVVNRRLKGEGLRRVTLVGFDEDGNVVLRDSVTAPSVRSQPNGPDCPPVCFMVEVRVDPEGRLVR